MFPMSLNLIWIFCIFGVKDALHPMPSWPIPHPLSMAPSADHVLVRITLEFRRLPSRNIKRSIPTPTLQSLLLCLSLVRSPPHLKLSLPGWFRREGVGGVWGGVRSVGGEAQDMLFGFLFAILGLDRILSFEGRTRAGGKRSFESGAGKDYGVGPAEHLIVVCGLTPKTERRKRCRKREERELKRRWKRRSNEEKEEPSKATMNWARRRGSLNFDSSFIKFREQKRIFGPSFFGEVCSTTRVTFCSGHALVPMAKIGLCVCVILWNKIVWHCVCSQIG